MSNLLLVTGANGFLGSEILRQAISGNVRVRGTDKHVSSVVSKTDYFPANILVPKTLLPICQGVTHVIHAAGLAHIFDNSSADMTSFPSVNENGTANVISASAEAGVGHFILISSVSVYGPFAQVELDENYPCNPVGPYALSKYNAEQRAKVIAKKSGMALTILRLATLYGEGDPGNVGRLMRAMDKRRFIWIGDGRNRKSLLHKGDAARACLSVAMHPASGINIYNVSAPPCSMRDIVSGLSRALGRKPLPGRIPSSVALGLTRFISRISDNRLNQFHQTLQKWLSEDVYDTRRFEEAYSFQTKFSLEDGLKREVDWYRQNQ